MSRSDQAAATDAASRGREPPDLPGASVAGASAMQAENAPDDLARKCRASAGDAGTLRSFVYLSDRLDYPATLP